MKNFLNQLAFKRELIKMVKRSKLKWSQKTVIVNAIMWRPDIVHQFKTGIEDACCELSESEHKKVLSRYDSAASIDWENFDWEAAADFWVKIIEAVAKIILALI